MSIPLHRSCYILISIFFICLCSIVYALLSLELHAEQEIRDLVSKAQRYEQLMKKSYAETVNDLSVLMDYCNATKLEQCTVTMNYESELHLPTIYDIAPQWLDYIDALEPYHLYGNDSQEVQFTFGLTASTKEIDSLFLTLDKLLLKTVNTNHTRMLIIICISDVASLEHIVCEMSQLYSAYLAMGVIQIIAPQYYSYAQGMTIYQQELLNYLYIMFYVQQQVKTDYYMNLDTSMEVSYGALHLMKKTIESQTNEWLFIDFANTVSFTGKLVRKQHLLQLFLFMHLFHCMRTAEDLLRDMASLKYCGKENCKNRKSPGFIVSLYNPFHYRNMSNA